MWSERAEAGVPAAGNGRGGQAAGPMRGRIVARAAQVIALVAADRGVPSTSLLEGQRGVAPVAEARQLAMYLMHVVDGCLYADIGKVFGRDRTTVAHACASIEERREAVVYDEAVDRLERMLAETETGAQP
jgi:chromosomal replication initiation ATPase DnaA